MQAALKEHGIGTAVHYPTPVHLQPYYLKDGKPQYSCPVTEKLVGEILSLPMYPELTEEQVSAVASEIKSLEVKAH
jgi:dTDP-4-amino-4,6-dideoxygalactose transaminase